MKMEFVGKAEKDGANPPAASEADVGKADGTTVARRGATLIAASVDSAEKPEHDADYVPPAERIIFPKDVAQFNDEDEVICIVGTRGEKVTRISGLESMTKLKVRLNRESELLEVRFFFPNEIFHHPYVSYYSGS